MSSKNPEQHSVEPLPSLGHFIADISRQARELDVLADQALLIDKDVDRYEMAVRQRAQLVADIPALLDQHREQGGEVPQDINDIADSNSAWAHQQIQSGNMFGMSVLLTRKGAPADEPNLLEQLAAQLLAQEENNPQA